MLKTIDNLCLLKLMILKNFFWQIWLLYVDKLAKIHVVWSQDFDSHESSSGVVSNKTKLSVL